MVPLVLLLIVFVPMLAEAQRAAANERAQLARGGVEAAGDVYRVMQIAYPLRVSADDRRGCLAR